MTFEPKRRRSPSDPGGDRDGVYRLYHFANCPNFRDEDAALKWLFERVSFVVDHELREMFLVGGRRDFDPHDSLARFPVER